AFVHQDAVADLHRRLRLAPGLSPVVASAHRRKLTSAIPARKPPASHRSLSSFCTSPSSEKSRSCDSGTRLSDLSSFKRAATANWYVASLTPPSALNDGRIKS